MPRDRGVDADEASMKECTAAFRYFDADGNNELDPNEFQQLAFSLGLMLTKDQAKAAVAEIDTDDSGTVSLQEFAVWWSQPEKPGAAGSVTSVNHLRRRLRAKTFRARTTTLAKQGLAAFNKHEGEADVTSLRGQLSVGDMGEVDPESRVKVRFMMSDDGEAAMEEIGGEAPVVVVLTFNAVEGAPDPESVVAPWTAFANAQLEDEPVEPVGSWNADTNTWTATLKFDEEAEMVGEILGSLGLETAVATLDFSQRPDDPETLNTAALEGEFNVEMLQSGFDVLREVATEMDMDEEEDVGILAIMLSVLDSGEFEFRFKDVAKFASVIRKVQEADGSDDSSDATTLRFVGSKGCGKTTLAETWANAYCPPGVPSTTDEQSYRHALYVNYGEVYCKVSALDGPSPEKDAACEVTETEEGYIVVFDVTDNDSYEYALERAGLICGARKTAGLRAPEFVFVGTHADGERVITDEQGWDMANNLGGKFVCVDARDYGAMDDSMLNLVERIHYLEGREARDAFEGDSDMGDSDVDFAELLEKPFFWDAFKDAVVDMDEIRYSMSRRNDPDSSSFAGWQLYKAALANIAGLSEIKVVAGSKVFTVTIENFPFCSTLLPKPEDVFGADDDEASGSD